MRSRRSVVSCLDMVIPVLLTFGCGIGCSGELARVQSCSADRGPPREGLTACDPVDCSLLGFCWKEDGGQCHAATDRDCACSSSCKEIGTCIAHDGYCATSSHTGCKDTKVCKTGGACTPNGHVCVVANDADCRASNLCHEAGACFADAEAQVCVAKSEADCRASSLCATKGKCALPLGPTVCFPGSAEDCTESSECKNLGECIWECDKQRCLCVK